MTTLARVALLTLVTGLVSIGATSVGAAPAVDLSNRPVAEIQIRGLKSVPRQLVLNNIRTKPGQPYKPDVVKEDIVRLTHLNRFGSVNVEIDQRKDGSLIVTYIVDEFPLIADVQVVGNKELTDKQLLDAALLRPGDPASPYLIQNGIQQMTRLYENDGYFASSIQYDQRLLNESGVLIFRVREGPRLRISDIRIEGNQAFTDTEIRRNVKSETYMIILRKGILNRETIEQDRVRIRDFYHNRGYLEAKVGWREQPSPNQKEAILTFFVEEGRRFTLANISVKGNRIFSRAQIVEAIPLKIGDVYTAESMQNTREAIEAIYHKIGFVRVRIQMDEPQHKTNPTVSLQIVISEGKDYKLGTVTVIGNTRTKDKVILRQLRDLEPGQPLDGTGIDRSRQRMNQSNLFGQAKLTLIDHPDDPDTLDLLVEVEEKRTGNIAFGVGVNSDLGLIGSIELTERNFDIADYPESFTEFFSLNAFKGAGQYFQIALQPGTENSRFAISFTEPAFLESDYSLSTSVFYTQQEREKHDEGRTGFTLGVGRRFGDVWRVDTNLRVERVDVDGIETDAPADVFDVAGDNSLYEIGISFTRTTLDNPFFPTRGNTLKVGVDYITGDFNFGRATAKLTQFWTIDRDFLGRPYVLKLSSTIGFVLPEDEAPVYERFYAGGHRTLRGFEYRGVGPRGFTQANVLTEEPVGGDFLFLLGLEYSFPLIEDAVRGVVFVDSGTVQDDFGLDKYRVSVGAGLRIIIPIFSQIPIALDFAVPVIKEEGDQEQFFSFDFAIPFQ